MFVTADQIRSVQWGDTSNWGVAFPSLSKKPFDTFFPATAVVETGVGIITKSIQTELVSIPIPSGVTLPSITITALDDDKRTLKTWLEEWVEQIAPGMRFVRPLSGCVRDLLVWDLDHTKELVPGTLRGYKVYPEGELVVSYTSDSSPATLTQKFVAVSRKKIR